MKVTVRLSGLDGRLVDAAMARLLARRRDAIEARSLREAARRRVFDGDLPDIGEERARNCGKDSGG